LFHLHRNDKLEQAAADCSRKGEAWACPAGVEADPDHREARDAADEALVVRNVFFGVGAAALVSGVVVWLATPGGEKVRVGAAPLAGGAVGSARVVF
jgi:hypothetical protein